MGDRRNKYGANPNMEGCPEETTLDVIGGKWKGIILYPPRVENSLTDFGKTLVSIILSMKKWGETYKTRLNEVRAPQGEVE